MGETGGYDSFSETLQRLEAYCHSLNLFRRLYHEQLTRRRVAAHAPRIHATDASSDFKLDVAADAATTATAANTTTAANTANADAATLAAASTKAVRSVDHRLL
ncbi:unnamed protein product [Phytophthora fragariaefolia]|uniref:Unnamed protein product n=1 Tax=Phytophthora fragariaefolia TaxID=1490495 RepID=A0A9W6XWU3_9STRA|nr:unnamed protein product [Phytophthora fragariaefolia]